MTLQVARRNIEQDLWRSVHAHPCCRPLRMVMAVPLVLALLAHPARALADGPAPSEQARAEVAADANEAVPEIESSEALESGDASDSDDTTAEDQESSSHERSSGRQDQVVSEEAAEGVATEPDRTQAPTPQDGETSSAPEGSASGDAMEAQVQAAQAETLHEPDASRTVATGPAATLVVWATRYPVGTCLATGALAVLALATLRARARQDSRQDVRAPSYHRRYHYLL